MPAKTTSQKAHATKKAAPAPKATKPAHAAAKPAGSVAAKLAAPAAKPASAASKTAAAPAAKPAAHAVKGVHVTMPIVGGKPATKGKVSTAVQIAAGAVTPTIQRTEGEANQTPMTPKNFRNHPDMENFFRFIYENDLRLEALQIIDEIIVARAARRAKKGHASSVATANANA